jgi:hypothetical protein
MQAQPFCLPFSMLAEKPFKHSVHLCDPSGWSFKLAIPFSHDWQSAIA